MAAEENKCTHWCFHAIRTPETFLCTLETCKFCGRSGNENCAICQEIAGKVKIRMKMWGMNDVVIADPCCNKEYLVDELSPLDLRRGFAHIKIPTIKPCDCKFSPGPFRFVWPPDIVKHFSSSIDDLSLVTIYLTGFKVFELSPSSTSKISSPFSISFSESTSSSLSVE